VASLELTDDDLTRLAKRIAPLLAAELGDATVRTADDDGRWLRTPEAARHLGMSVSELHRRASAGAIPHEQEGPGAALYFRRSDLDAWRRGEGSR
jgi:predicted DNA-binding transcriptional regulator AlpA